MKITAKKVVLFFLNFMKVLVCEEICTENQCKVILQKSQLAFLWHILLEQLVFIFSKRLYLARSHKCLECASECAVVQSK
jgi:hypothetical protein